MFSCSFLVIALLVSDCCVFCESHVCHVCLLVSVVSMRLPVSVVPTRASCMRFRRLLVSLSVCLRTGTGHSSRGSSKLVQSTHEASHARSLQSAHPLAGEGRSRLGRELRSVRLVCLSVYLPRLFLLFPCLAGLRASIPFAVCPVSLCLSLSLPQHSHLSVCLSLVSVVPHAMYRSLCSKS